MRGKMKKPVFTLFLMFLCTTCFFIRVSSSGEGNVVKPTSLRTSISAPSLTVTTSNSTVSMTWTSVSDATGYTLYYAPYPDITYIQSIDMGNQISFSANLPVDNAFYVAIQAYNE
jgi:hypothetical protein